MKKIEKMRKLLFMAIILSSACLSACDFTTNDSNEVSITDSMSCIESSTISDDVSLNNSISEPNIDLNLFEKAPEIRLGSFLTGSETSNIYYLKQKAPYTDTYLIKANGYTIYDIYDENGKCLANLQQGKSVRLELEKEQIIYGVAKCTTKGKQIGFNVTLKENYSLLPYDPLEFVDAEKLLSDSKTDTTTITPANVSYKKRDGGMYINCNNPEKLTEDCLNTALTRENVSNKEVFFTFEHNNSISGPFYYGYQVINKGTEDVYVTVKNIGLHLDGAGSWLGEKEWIDFYNMNFKVKNFNNYTPSQLANFQAYFGFSNAYVSPNQQPITYRVPAGKHIYVMGGTTKDAYENINVFNTANKPVEGGCSNGAVLFEVVGDNVEGAFYVYKDYRKVQIDNKTHQGYVVTADGHEYGRQYVGYDNCHGVVDAELTWEFNDNNKSQYLPVTFTNYYKDNVSDLGTPYSLIESTAHIQKSTKWTTHINPQANHNAVGTDMTKYFTVDENGNEICIDANHYDGTGQLANIGNWMIDYIENFTFVNHGNTNRSITISFVNNGAIAVLFRDKDGKYIKDTAQYTIKLAKSTYGDGIDESLEYTVEIPAHSYVQFSLEYNLLANSYGNIEHKVWLK